EAVHTRTATPARAPFVQGTDRGLYHGSVDRIAMRWQGVSPGWSSLPAGPPAELRRDVAQDRLDGMRVVVHTELVRHGQQKRVGGSDGGVFLQLPDQLFGLG